jgi:excisionase family DNA binding protein
MKKPVRSPESAEHNDEKTTTRSTVKEEVPRMKTTTTPSTKRLEQALETFVEDLEGLESQLLKFEEALLELEEGSLKEGSLKEGFLNEEAPENGRGQNTTRLLSPSEVCQELGEEGTVVYRRLRNGQIPSLKLGHALKVRRADLQEYMKTQQRRQLR